MADGIIPIPITLTQARAVVADLEAAAAVMSDNRRPRATWAPRAIKEIIPATHAYLEAYGAPHHDVAGDRYLPERFADRLREEVGTLRYRRSRGGDWQAQMDECLREQAEIRQKYPSLEADLARYRGGEALPDALSVLRAIAEYSERWSVAPAGDPDAVEQVGRAFSDRIVATRAHIVADALARYIHPRNQAVYNLGVLRDREALLRERVHWTRERVAEMGARVEKMLQDLAPLWSQALGPSRPPPCMGDLAPPPPQGWWARLRSRFLARREAP